MNPVAWAVIGATVATVVYTVASVFSVFNLVRQLRAQSFSEVYERLQGEVVREARGVIYEMDERSVSFEEWKADAASVAAVESICQRYDYFAKMVRFHFLPKKIILRSWAWQVDRLWRVAKPFVRSRRAIPGQGRLWEDFQWLARKSSKWLSKTRRTAVLPVER